MKKRIWCLMWFTPVLFGMSFAANANEHNKCKTNIGKVVSKQGSVVINRAETGKWERVRQRSEVCEGDTIRTGVRSRAAVSLVNETVMRINQKSTARMENFAPQEETRAVLRLISGIIQFFSRKPKNYQIATVTATIGIRGTEFVVVADDNKTEVTVFEGVVQAENDTVPLALSAGETVGIVGGQTMRSNSLVNPRNQVQWGLYYPPVLSVSEISNPALQDATSCINQGDYACAFEALESVASTNQDDNYFYLNAALLVAVGQTEEAGAIIDDLLLGNSNDATALALRSVIAVSQNRTSDALDDAAKAVEASPDSLSARIALSYAQQADLDLQSATDTMQQAVNSHPDNALAKARLAELLLATGRVADAREMAESATGSGNDSARAHTVLGYTALAQIDTEIAINAFNRALDIDSADPQPHLGLGLALIRNGELEAGRQEIEAAVALDSNSAILRPYLGRAYYEENRSPLDADQYAIAKQLDNNDPTAYLFDAIRKHSANQPVEAAQDLQASIERNDNRAVYRSRNLLDQDRAARGASLARIYDTLGFSGLGILESGNSLAVNPANESAHRFLSDSYRNIRRREISRVSELLQAQMLQDVNLNPVQPSVSATNLNIGSGAGDVGLNEFSGLFESNGFHPAVSLISGDNNTDGAEVVLSGVQGSLSYSVGGFHYKTDGWRENNGQEQDLGNLFVQWAATPQLNLQFEVSTRDSTEGDLAFNFDADAFDPTLQHDRDIDSDRIGLRYSPASHSDILVSHIESEREEKIVAKQGFPAFTALGPIPPDPANPFPPLPPCPPVCVPDPASIDTVLYDFDNEQVNESSQSELQYLLRLDSFNLVAGISTAEVDIIDKIVTVAPPEAVELIIPEFDDTSESSIEHDNAYIYATFFPLSSVDLTIGVSEDDFDDSTLTEKVSSTNAKFGARWRINERQSLRIAALEVTKSALANNRTLEPTQVAGFNQMFDDVNGTNSRLAGLGYDLALSDSVRLGFEAISREMEIPFLFIDINNANALSTEIEDQEEENVRIYINWMPTKTIAVSAELISDIFESGDETEINTPRKAKTQSLPISFKYFSPNRWFAGITATLVDQEITRDPLSELGSGKDDFNVVDLSIGYRLAKRRGSLSLNILNATDEEFNYQDDTYREFRNEPSTGPYFPETTVQFQANLVF